MHVNPSLRRNLSVTRPCTRRQYAVPAKEALAEGLNVLEVVLLPAVQYAHAAAARWVALLHTWRCTWAMGWWVPLAEGASLRSMTKRCQQLLTGMLSSF